MVALVSRTGREFQRYDDEGRRQVVGCIPYRYKTGKSPSHEAMDDSQDLEVLLISSQKSHAMLFPKGGWEMDESMKEAAKRETMEEAGVEGNVESQLGKWFFKSKSHDAIYEGYMFPLLVEKQLDIWPEKHVRQRKWMTVDEAREVCQPLWMKEALDRLVRRLRQEEEEELVCPLS
ncbi:PREDICTED: nudix hydrolase 18, mitochondrial-like [Nelumbo nucifera]|uniref:Nudix hydrolase 18, mitochondrial-like n=1 Tax=Nelumbo nucifera TaxID=4432 RepID=A0A1U8Q3A9_NELNU|nr:PREDICTED: nudix hydrolase 18, mitochondrial-like [Nelumbo nucifera]